MHIFKCFSPSVEVVCEGNLSVTQQSISDHVHRPVLEERNLSDLKTVPIKRESHLLWQMLVMRMIDRARSHYSLLRSTYVTMSRVCGVGVPINTKACFGFFWIGVLFLRVQVNSILWVSLE